MHTISVRWNALLEGIYQSVFDAISVALLQPIAVTEQPKVVVHTVAPLPLGRVDAKSQNVNVGRP